MVAPKGPGHLLRSVVCRRAAACRPCSRSSRTPRGTARARVLAYARGLGSTRAGVLETTFAEETETDLFGEQALLCGGVSALVKAAFETLVEAGYQPELAYFETMHELKLIVDLMYRGGLNYMRFSVSDTAEYGDYVSGPRVTEGVKATMKDVLTDIQSGRFADNWIAENESGGREFERMRQADRDHQIEQVGAHLRSQMAWLDPVEVEPRGQASPASRRAAQARRRPPASQARPMTTDVRPHLRHDPARRRAGARRRADRRPRRSRSPASWCGSTSTSSRPDSRPPRRATSRPSSASRRETKGVAVAGLARCRDGDPQRAVEALRAPRSRTSHLFIAT